MTGSSSAIRIQGGGSLTGGRPALSPEEAGDARGASSPVRSGRPGSRSPNGAEPAAIMGTSDPAYATVNARGKPGLSLMYRADTGSGPEISSGESERTALAGALADSPGAVQPVVGGSPEWQA